MRFCDLYRRRFAVAACLSGTCAWPGLPTAGVALLLAGEAVAGWAFLAVFVAGAAAADGCFTSCLAADAAVAGAGFAGSAGVAGVCG